MRFLWLTLLLVGCGGMQRGCTYFTGDFTYKCAKSGVEYVQSDSGIALLVERDGRPMACK